MDSRQVRNAFIDFFKKEGHTHVESSALIPQGDPTLLFVNAGMVQFKDVFTGMESRNYTRAASYQRCMRVSGKHNDLENVGYTARHHTLFEMLGNFSFGDYFKEEAIDYAWRFLMNNLDIPVERLYFTVFREDDEAEKLWIKRGAAPDRVLRFDEKDNFWAMGETGPCGPNSEILFDQGEDAGCGAAGCAPGCDCDRYLEIWNLVFMQFQRDSDGMMKPLEKVGVDTGMGLERAVAVVQGKLSNYDTDLFVPLIDLTAEIANIRPGLDKRSDTALKVIADHLRSCVFLVCDGVMPANTGAGYVLRKILRRAARYGDMAGIKEPFMHRLAPGVIQILGEAYPDLSGKCDHISRVIRMEEERFAATLAQGRCHMEEIISRCRHDGVIPGEDAFQLYDTFGFPLDLTRDIAEKAGIKVDTEGYQKNMQMQRERAQAASKFGYEQGDCLDLNVDVCTSFCGYDCQAVEGVISACEGNRLILEKTPFYAEAGGQLGDTGTMESPDGSEVRVVDVKKNSRAQIVHVLDREPGWKPGDTVYCRVDKQRREEIERNHTATHLLHRALREILGDHVVQAGSMVAPERLRFDFKHYTALKSSELLEIEGFVNKAVMLNRPVKALETNMAGARELGAMMLFGEKYGDQVRVISVDGHGAELCGGCHVSRTGDIGLFKVISESATGANIRRIEAVTGTHALHWVNSRLEVMDQAARVFRCPALEVPDRIEKMMAEKKEILAELNELRLKLATTASCGEAPISEASEVGGMKYVARRMDGLSVSQLRTAADEMAEKLGSGVVVLGTGEPKVLFIAKVTEDLVSRGVHAGKLIKRIATKAGGGGGGRADFAQAGGSRPEMIDDAFSEGETALREMAASQP